MNPIVPLTPSDRQMALDFGKRHAPAKAERVCLNILAVLAVCHHLQSLDIAASLERSDSWDIAMQAFGDVGDLFIEGKGAIECRPVLPNAVACRVPFEVREDRLGFIAVRLNESLSDAELLGFLEKIESEGEEIPLDRFAPLETLWDVLECNPVANVLQWLDGAFVAGWEMLEDLSVPEVGFAFRNVAVKNAISGGKLLNAKSDSLSETLRERLVLLATLEPVGSSEWDATIALQPRDANCLPEGMRMFLRDREDNILMQAESRKSEALCFEFGVEVGETFSVEVKWREWQVREQFILDAEVSAA